MPDELLMQETKSSDVWKLVEAVYSMLQEDKKDVQDIFVNFLVDKFIKSRHS
jgi:hypothetical protein